MDTSKFLKRSLFLGLGFVAGTAAELNYYEVNTTNELKIINNYFRPSSTNFNNPRRFSLEQLRLNKFKLRSFRNLKDNWNGYNSKPLDEELISMVCRF